MEDRSMIRASAVALASASMVVALAGCTAARTTSTPQPDAADAKPKKEYQWKDMSTGKSFFRPIDPSSNP